MPLLAGPRSLPSRMSRWSPAARPTYRDHHPSHALLVVEIADSSFPGPPDQVAHLRTSRRPRVLDPQPSRPLSGSFTPSRHRQPGVHVNPYSHRRGRRRSGGFARRKHCGGWTWFPATDHAPNDVFRPPRHVVAGRRARNRRCPQRASMKRAACLTDPRTPGAAGTSPPADAPAEARVAFDSTPLPSPGCPWPRASAPSRTRRSDTVHRPRRQRANHSCACCGRSVLRLQRTEPAQQDAACGFRRSPSRRSASAGRKSPASS